MDVLLQLGADCNAKDNVCWYAGVYCGQYIVGSILCLCCAVLCVFR